MKIPYYDLEIVHETIRAEVLRTIERTYDSNHFILGNELTSFETLYASYLKIKYCVGVSNGLDALKLSLIALGIGRGDEVIVPSNTFIATILAIELVGATPVLVEPDIKTYNLDPTRIECKINSKTKAIIAVHLYGQPADMTAIRNIAIRYDLKIIEDNAQSPGAYWGDEMTGSIGDINATSFYPAKNLGALGDSGAIMTNDSALYERCKKLSNYGSKEKYIHEIIGFNNRMDELQAAVLKVKLKYLDDWNLKRRQIAKSYIELLSGLSDIVLPYSHPKAHHVYHIFVIRSSRRDSLKEHLASCGISTLIHYPIPPHRQQAFSDKSYYNQSFPIAEELADTVLSLPLFPGLTDPQIEYVCDKIRSFYHE